MTDETKRPWRVGLHPCDDWTIYGPNGEKVAFNVNGSISDANLIVRAINSYDALCEALEPVANMEIWAESADDNEIVIMTVGTIRKMRAALAETLK